MAFSVANFKAITESKCFDVKPLISLAVNITFILLQFPKALQSFTKLFISNFNYTFRFVFACVL